MTDTGTNGSTKRMSMIVSKGSLDWAYPPFILATTAASMGLDVTLFFTFYGLGLLRRKLDLKVTPLGNAAMEMPMMGTHVGMPNMLGMLPGMETLTTVMMKDMIRKKGVASIEELRSLAVDAGVRMIACQMTMDLFEMSADDLIDGIELAGAASYIEEAAQSQINLFV